ncbi:MAG: hypothetical protein WAZ19_07350, partial [Anaerolineae bacterium]
MNHKWLGKWVIVLLLLAALPGLTAVMAQGQEPARKAPLPAVTEVGESAPITPWVNNEKATTNDSMATAEDWLKCTDTRSETGAYNPELTFKRGCVLGGKIDSASDADYWQLRVEYADDGHVPILFDIDAASNGWPLDALICLYADDAVLMGCNDDTDTVDSLMFYNLETGRTYYLRVSSADETGGSNYKYQLLISTPLLISAAAANLGTGNVAGIPFLAGDILAWSRYYNQMEVGLGSKWVMFLDLSDLNVKGNLTNLASAWRNSDYLFVGFAANTRLPGIAKAVTPWDVVLFDPSTIGPNTTGVFQLWWAGKEHQLTTSAEKVDAIDWPNWNGAASLYVSTIGNAKVGVAAVKTLADEDFGQWHPNNEWSKVDMSVIDWMAAKDVIALDHNVSGYSDTYDEILMVLQGQGYLDLDDDRFTPDVFVTQKDIVELNTQWAIGGNHVFWHGPDHG